MPEGLGTKVKLTEGEVGIRKVRCLEGNSGGGEAHELGAATCSPRCSNYENLQSRLTIVSTLFAFHCDIFYRDCFSNSKMQQILAGLA